MSGFMSIVPDALRRIFEREARALGWAWIPDEANDPRIFAANMRPAGDHAPFAAGEDYVVLRLAEMYLRRTRVLWREYYPLVHSFVGYGDPAALRSVASIAGPGQLRDLGTDNLDRLIGLSYRLAGPLVYDGQDIELLAGLYAVPAKDGAKLLIDTLAQLSGLVPALKQATDVAGIVKGGVEGLLGMSGTTLALGVHDALRAPGIGAGRPARPGFLVAINAPAAGLDTGQLWIKDGRLYEGADPVVARPFERHDMMLFELHRGPSRAAAWATLPNLAPHATSFDTALKDMPADQLAPRVNDLFRKFEADLRASADLTVPDKSAIRALVGADLKKRVEDIRGGGLIETRSVAGLDRQVSARSFSAMDIELPPPGVPLPSRADDVPLFP